MRNLPFIGINFRHAKPTILSPRGYSVLLGGGDYAMVKAGALVAENGYSPWTLSLNARPLCKGHLSHLAASTNYQIRLNCREEKTAAPKCQAPLGFWHESFTFGHLLGQLKVWRAKLGEALKCTEWSVSREHCLVYQAGEPLYS